MHHVTIKIALPDGNHHTFERDLPSDTGASPFTPNLHERISNAILNEIKWEALIDYDSTGKPVKISNH